MRESIDFLPEHKKNELNRLVKIIRAEVKGLEMVVLYGTHASQPYDDGENNRCYDLLLLTQKPYDELKLQIVWGRVLELYFESGDGTCRTWPRVKNQSLFAFNREVGKYRYEYIAIALHGIRLYASPKAETFSLKRVKIGKFNNSARSFFSTGFETAMLFISKAKQKISRKQYDAAAYMLYCSAECFLRLLPMGLCNFDGYEHDLEMMFDECKVFSQTITDAFCLQNPQHVRLYGIMRYSYVRIVDSMERKTAAGRAGGRIKSRYPKIEISKNDITAIVSQIKLLGTITEGICKSKLNYYGSLEKMPY